jgi:hypothetical protein
LAFAFGWLWMDPLAGIIGAFVIASWSYALIWDTGAILLDMNPDRSMATNLRQAVESEGDQIADLHLNWGIISPGKRAVIEVVTATISVPSGGMGPPKDVCESGLYCFKPRLVLDATRPSWRPPNTHGHASCPGLFRSTHRIQCEPR